jgi:hypothetical protein
MDREPRLVVCAWCEYHGHKQAAVRPADHTSWLAASHDFARVVKRAGLASHGICTACLERELRGGEPANTGRAA